MLVSNKKRPQQAVRESELPSPLPYAGIIRIRFKGSFQMQKELSVVYSPRAFKLCGKTTSSLGLKSTDFP
jgi:hypothetical protein